MATPEEMLQTMISNMPEKTGQSLDDWHVLLKTSGLAKHGELMKLLKGEHGVTHGFANTIVAIFNEKNAPTEDLVANQYAGKELLMPIYEALISIIEKFGDDVVITPKKTSVSIIRKKQFALIKPATKTRIDLGLKLKNTAVQGRLENSGPFGTMCTHRIQLENAADIDQDVIGWLLTAYEQST